MNKNYKIEQSPLYKLSRKKKLAELLGVPVKEICYFQENEIEQYKVWLAKKSEKERQIEAPNKHLKMIQKKLNKLLSRIEPPDWVFSGIKKRSYISNAKSHINDSYFVKIDISKFYRSCDKEYIFRFFKYNLLNSDDIAWVLTHLTVFEDYVPTGAPTSQTIALRAYFKCFEEIVRTAELNNIQASLYVDDFTFSSQKPISKEFIFKVDRILKKYKLIVKKKKTRSYNAKTNKLITGVIITPKHEIRIPNRLRLKIKTKYEKLFSTTEINYSIYNSLLGLLQSARQIEEHAFEDLYYRLKKIKPVKASF